MDGEVRPSRPDHNWALELRRASRLLSVGFVGSAPSGGRHLSIVLASILGFAKGREILEAGEQHPYTWIGPAECHAMYLGTYTGTLVEGVDERQNMRNGCLPRKINRVCRDRQQAKADGGGFRMSRALTANKVRRTNTHARPQRKKEGRRKEGRKEGME